MRRPTLALLTLSLVACEDVDPPTELELPHGPDLEFSAETVVGGVTPVQITSTVTVRNEGDETGHLGFGSLCFAFLEVYADSARSGEPAWSHERIAHCLAMTHSDSIRPGDSIAYSTPATDAEQILGDSLPEDHYWLSVLIPSGTGIRVPAGEVDLTLD